MNLRHGAEPDAGLLVIIDATVRTAHTAHTLDCHTVFVQRPGTRVDELVDDFSGYYTVDFTTQATGAAGTTDTTGVPGAFVSFVEEVLRPLAPRAVVSLSTDGALPAAIANSLLGTVGTPIDVLRRLVAWTPGGAADDVPQRCAYTFSAAGVHRWVALVDEERAPIRAEQVVPERLLSSDEYGVVEAALCRFLDSVGLSDGPARIRLRSRDGEVRILGASPGVGTDEEVELVRRLTGFDLTRSALRRALGLAGDEVTSPARAQEGATR